MKSWFSPIICIAIFGVLFGAVAGYYHVDHRLQEERAHGFTTYLLSCKTDDLDIETFGNHYRTHYDDYSDRHLNEITPKVSGLLQAHPDAKLFHYNTPEKDWEQLGGRKGYAIRLNFKILWEYRMGFS